MPKRMKLLRRDWPEADRDWWDRLFQRGDIFEASGPLADLRARSQTAFEATYGLWLARIAEAEPAALTLAPDERATPERLVAWLDTMSHLQPVTRLNRFLALSKVLRSLAPKWRTEAHRRLERRLRHDVQGHQGPRKQGRILPGQELVARCVQELLLLRKQPPSRMVALQVRDITLIAFLAFLPLRRKNVAGLELGKTLLRTGEGWRVDFEGAAMKTGRPFSALLPATLAELLSSYVDTYRPMLMGPEAAGITALWIGDHGLGWSPHTLGLNVTALTRSLFGTAISPHLFRDCAATTMILASPDHAALAPALLGHHSAETSRQHYLQARGIEAGRQYAGIVNLLRRSS